MSESDLKLKEKKVSDVYVSYTFFDIYLIKNHYVQK